MADERPSVPGVQKPAFAIFARDLNTADCSVIASRLGASFSNVVINGPDAIGSDGFKPDVAAAQCSATLSDNVIKFVSERAAPWVPCRNYGTQYEEGVCSAGYAGVVTYSREYSCAANGGFEPGALGPRTQVKSVCCLALAPQTDVRADCSPSWMIGTRTWRREYS